MIKSLKKFQVDKSIYGVLIFQTFYDNGNLVIFNIGFYIFVDKKKYLKMYYFKDFYEKDIYLASLNMIKKCFKDLNFLLGNKKAYIYIHNLGKNGYLIFKSLLALYGKNCNILMDSESKFIEIKVENLILRDSFRIFNTPLKHLVKFINLKEKKLDWNFNKDITLEEILNKKFNLKSQLIYFYEIIKYFSNLLLKTYNLPLYKVYSASNMAFNIFRINYLKKDIKKINYFLYKMIKPSYFGGMTQKLRDYGENLYHYDINSLYPYAMLNDMPGNYIRFYKDINTDFFIKNNLFGFYNCKIFIANPNISIIPYRLESGNLIYPKNQIITGLYFSEEIKSWLKLGYKIEIQSGYEFEKIKNLFKDYILTFYSFKSEDSNLKSFYKLLLNGLYGYFGRDTQQIITRIVDEKAFNNFAKYFTLLNYTILNDNLYLIKYYNSLDFSLNQIEVINFMKENRLLEDQSINSNIAISSAITSYARIYMQQFILSPNYNIYYSDTDSIIIDKPLDSSLINNNIGFMKLENKIKEAYFINNKVYAYINDQDMVIMKTAGVPTNLVSYQDFIDMHKGIFKNYQEELVVKGEDNLNLIKILKKYSLKKN